MDNFNKILSFVLGLVVVIVFIAVITGRLNLRNRLARVSGGSPTPVRNLYFTPSPTRAVQAYTPNQTKTPSSIPSTGSPTHILLFAVSGLLGGIYLRKRNS